jgi:hypothetical protein
MKKGVNDLTILIQEQVEGGPLITRKKKLYPGCEFIDISISYVVIFGLSAENL